MRTLRLKGKRPRISPLRYPGGKAALFPRIQKLIEDSGLIGCTYIEPYAGGAGAGLGLLVSGQVERVVINDLDPAIHAFWHTVVNQPELFIQRIQEVRLDVSEWRRQKEIYRAGDQGNIADLGFATFYLNRTNRSGVLNGGPIGGLDQTGKYKIDARFNRATLVERIQTLSSYADKIVVTSMDGVDLIRQYAHHPNIFFYADPPYFEKAGTLYLNHFRLEDHVKLAELLNSIPEIPWLLTYDNVSQVARLYGSRRRRTFELHYSAHRVITATEVAVLSDSVADIQEGWPV